jgi:hypothetical protein
MDVNNGESLFSTLSKVHYPQIDRFTPESLDWLFEHDKESVDLLNWLNITLSSDSYLSDEQIESYNQIPVSERLTGGKVLEEALESLQDEDSSITNEDLERKIAELESELGYNNDNCETMTGLKTQLSDSERLSSIVLNQLHEQVEKGRRDNRKGQESVLEINTAFNVSLNRLKNCLQEYRSKYENTSAIHSAADKVHVFQIDVDQVSSKESELNQTIGSLISTVFGNKYNNLGLFQTPSDLLDDDKPKVMDLESKDLLELVRGRDRTEFQHLKSEIYRIRACLFKSERERINQQARNAGLLACMDSLNQSLRLNRNTVLVSIPGDGSSCSESILSCLNKVASEKENSTMSDLISRCISYYCQRVLTTDYNIKYRRSAYMFKKLQSIRDELLQSRAREQLLDLLLAQEAEHINSIVTEFKQNQQILDERYRKRQGFKSAVGSLEGGVTAQDSQDCCDTKPGMVIKPNDFSFTILHKLLRYRDHVDPVATYAGVEQAVSALIQHKQHILIQIQHNKDNRLHTMHSIETAIRRLSGLLHVDQFSPSRGISLIPKEVSRAISQVDKEIKHLEIKLKAILTNWEQAKADLKTRPYRRNQRQLWIDFLLKPELVPANVRAVQNRAK